MVSDTLLNCGPSTPSRYIGSPIGKGNTPARCGRVHQDQLILGKCLGVGGFGSVYVASMRGRTVAVKTYHKRSGSQSMAIRQSYLCELTAFRLGLKHANIASVLGATSLQDFAEGAWIVMEYVGEKTLQQLLNDPGVTVEHNQRLSFSLQIARGLHYLHSVNVVHLDLKPANILVTADNRLRIADFGCCHQIPPGREEGDVPPRAALADAPGVGEGERLAPAPAPAPVQVPWRNELAGTLAYRAPELLRGQRPALRSDVYSLGITLWQLQTRAGPYEGVPAHAVVFQVVAKHLRPLDLPGAPPSPPPRSSLPPRLPASSVSSSITGEDDNDDTADDKQGDDEVDKNDDVFGEAENNGGKLGESAGGDDGDDDNDDDDNDDDDDKNDDDPFEILYSDLYRQCWAPAVEDRPTSLEVVHVIGMWLENLDK